MLHFVLCLYFTTQYIKITYYKQNITIGVTKSLLNVKERKKMKRTKKLKCEIKEKLELNYLSDRKWKEENNKYLQELQIFFDKMEKIKDQDLRNNLLNQMLQCDKALTEIAEEMFIKYYEIGYKKAKEE